MRSFPLVPLALMALGLAACARSAAPAARPSAASAADARLDVRFVTDEPEAVLALLDARAAGRAPAEAEWRRLFESEGYVRLKAREASLGRAFTDSAFRAFVLSDTLLARRAALRRTLEAWTRLDPNAAAARAFRYLPATTVVRARVYPSIKPRENSFVFEPRTNPAIFLFVDPSVSAADLENTVAHELHHIGFAAACPDEPPGALEPGTAAAVDWMGAFAEGLAMLAAADGPDADPHATSGAAERAVWLRDLGNAQADIARMEAFFTDLMERRLSDDDALRTGFTFINSDTVPQGAFYTVGWLMASTVERELGRARLVEHICDPRRLLLDYDSAAALAAAGDGSAPPRWSAPFLERVRSSYALDDARAAADARLRDIAAAASADRVGRDLATLVGFGTRHTLSDTLSATRGIGAARRWVHAELSRIAQACGGCIAVEYHATMAGGTQRMPDSVAVVNVLGIQRGTTDPNRYILVSGHLDSRASDVMDAVSDAPGAVDDASGVAAVLETARLLSRYRFPATIVYVAVSGEEQGLIGAAALAERAAREGWFVEAMLNNDVVGNVQGQDGITDSMSVRVFSEGVRATETEAMARARRATGGESDSPARQLARYVEEVAAVATPAFRVLAIQRLDRFGRGGDHSAFAARGFPAVRFTETHEDYRRQHQDVRVEDGVAYGDVLEEAEPSYTARVAGLDAAVIAALAWAPPPPDSVAVRGAVQPSTTLSWAAIDRARAPDLLGYVVRWRETTSPAWQHEVFVGDTTAFTLENVVVDNWFFGVAAVGRDGHRSPTVFAGPVGAWRPPVE